MTNQYTRPGSATVPIAVNDVILITTPEGTNLQTGTGGGGDGAQGTQGVRGAQGTQGVQGTTGLGTQGTQGTSGADGIDGSSLDNTDDLTEGLTNKYFTVERVSFEHNQGSASNSWTITHNLGFKPNVTVIDSAGNIVEGEIAYTNSNLLTVSFASAFSGKAYLS
jgi:hypothetical protein